MVIANMIGTGIFTSIGFQVMPGAIPDVFAILMIWLLGGLFALCGATCYAEVSTTLKGSGGEYHFLSKLYHPVLGLASGWVSMVVGFSAAIASLALAAGAYFEPVIQAWWPSIPAGQVPKLFGLILILVVTGVQVLGVRASGRFQNLFTYIKLGFLLFLVVAPLIWGSESTLNGEISFLPGPDSWETIGSMAFAGSLVWVMFAYSGWNASSYIAGNMENPRQNLPFSLTVGTAVVALLYLALTAAFLYTCTFSELAGKVDVGNEVITKVLGGKASLWFGALFALTLLSGINAMYIAGPRISQKMGQDYSIFRGLKNQNQQGAPVAAILLQTLISGLLVVFSNFKDIVEYIGLTLSLFSLLTVAGVFIIRARKWNTDQTVKAWGYPVTPILYIAMTVWMITFFAKEDPMKLLWSLGTVLPALLFYKLSKRD
jgi:APA family basic amino acid/polyamine antiporter